MKSEYRSRVYTDRPSYRYREQYNQYKKRRMLESKVIEGQIRMAI